MRQYSCKGLLLTNEPVCDDGWGRQLDRGLDKNIATQMTRHPDDEMVIQWIRHCDAWACR
jgi:hypothetical protein